MRTNRGILQPFDMSIKNVCSRRINKYSVIKKKGKKKTSIIQLTCVELLFLFCFVLERDVSGAMAT